MQVIKKNLDELSNNLKELDDTIAYEFRQAAEAHQRQGKRIKVDGDINVIAMSGLILTVLALVYQVATWTTAVNIKLDVMTGLMAQTAENTKDIKELRAIEMYSPRDKHDK